MGMKTVVPTTAADAKGAIKAAIREDDPVMIFAPAALLADKGPVPDGEHLLELGRARIAREGSDLTIVAVGPLVPQAEKCAATLANDGISAEVLDVRSLLPLDRDGIIRAVRRTGRVVIFDDSNRTCGFAAEIAALVAEEAWDVLQAPVRRITRADVPVPFSPPLEAAVLPSADRLLDACRACLETVRT
jgi:pyruvate dehydrogenase E1 component beta subunit